VQHTFYDGFAIVGGIAEVLGLISTGVVSAAAGERTSFILTLMAALSFLGMLALFAFGSNPLNQEIATWTPETLPADWREVRGLLRGTSVGEQQVAAWPSWRLLRA
jgi:hypothetical protein